MEGRIPGVRFLAALLAAVSLNASAAPFAVTLGGDRVVLDSIPGLSDALPLGSPRIQELAESLTSASNRILLFALTDADIRRFGLGERTELKRYMLAVTPNHLERERVTAAQFKLLIDDAQRDTGKPAEIVDYMKHLDGRPHGQPTMLAQIQQTGEVYSVLLGTRVPETGGWLSKPQYIVSSNSFLLVRQKALSVSVFSSYEGPQDIEWIRFVTERWIDTLRKLNAR